MKNLEQLRSDLTDGTTTSEKLVQESLSTIAATKEQNAYISVLNENALVAAQEIDVKIKNGELTGPLAGIPIAIKDNICTTGTKTTCGSKILENFESPYNATVVEKLKAAGAIIIGKTNMDEFAMGSSSETSFYGTTVNPTNPEVIPGGSSGGSAAAVASGSVAISLGSDTGGSIRQPAACCGIVGMKPTYGRVSRYGLVSYASSLDQIGPLATTVKDTASVLNVISGIDKNDTTSSNAPVEDFSSLIGQDLAGKTIGIPAEYFGEGLDPTHKEKILESLERLKSEGAELKEVHLPNLKHAVSSYYIIATAEASSNLSRYDGVRFSHRTDKTGTLEEMYCNTRAEGFGDEVKRRILLGSYVLSSGFFDAYYIKAQKVRRVITNDFKKAFEACDIIAAPTMPSNPLKLGESLTDPMAMYLSDIYTVSLNLAGLPGISVPCSTVDNHKLGLQLFGKAFGESELLQIAAGVERNFA
ncbi:MAG: Asp-tRNA(Asn)/Glu-tRNA(Gln) amidotransferase subunit GatA [Fibrobacterales bacterium]